MNTMKKSRNYIIASFLVILILFIIYTICILSKAKPIEIQGEVDATQIKVASKIIGRIDSLGVHKGQDVKQGDLLFVINSPELEAKKIQASAVKLAAEAQQEKAENGAQSEDIQAAFNTWQKAKAAAEYAQKTYSRINNLYEDGVIAEQKKDETEMYMKAATETEKAAKSIYEKAQKGARYEDKEAAGALVKQAEGVLTELNSYINETQIYAPINGEISNILAERGELIPAGYPIITVVDLNDIWIVFNLTEDLLSDIAKDDIIPAKFPALKMKEVKLKITYINALGDYATKTATKTSGDFDMKTFEVHAVPVEKTEGLRPGMSALVNWNNIVK
ncbi:MAG: efflux RND transporter periplasmic adaptor subunit [Bacteroidales bacterium]|nr:efflux RND transporter periplasmic adaptor subunit [Bacteroidales bacterium]